jgi:hypothetical protein
MFSLPQLSDTPLLHPVDCPHYPRPPASPPSRESEHEREGKKTRVPNNFAVKMMSAVLIVTATAAASLAPAAQGNARATTRSSSFELTLHLYSAATPETLDELFWKVATPGTHHYLNFATSPEELAEIGFGAPTAAVTAATAWLHGLNGTDVRVSAMKDYVTATFSVAAQLHAAQGLWSDRGLPRGNPPSGVQLVTRRDEGLQPGAPAAAEKRAYRSRASYTVGNIKAAYGVPADRATTNPATTQMVWGPGTFGYSPSGLEEFRERECPGINTAKVKFDTAHHGQPGGDNFGEGTLDTHMISAFGMNATTIVSNTNTSMSTEEGDGFGLALLDFVTELASRPSVPHVLSLSLGSLSAFSCDLLCSEAVKTGETSHEECEAFLQQQRQVCMFTSKAQVARINLALQALGMRGVSVLGSSGDGGSHWSFGPFRGFGKMARLLNKIGCEFQFPIFPSPSPYMVSVGGTEWRGGSPSRPVMWSGSGGGFSWQFAAPTHQQAAVSAYLQATAGLPPASSYNRSGRAYPDISAVAVDGTSQSSPLFAGIFTLLIDARLNAGLKPLGPLGPRIYQVAQAHPGAAFEDVTEGNSQTSCDNGFPAATGWDPTTGFGRPVWAGLLKFFGSDDSL